MGKGQLTKAIGVGMGLVILSACRSSHLEADSCLADVEANALDRALQRCNRVVKAHPQDPRPRNDRFLLHTLLQKQASRLPRHRPSSCSAPSQRSEEPQRPARRNFGAGR